jgi:hypothetical protein
VYAIRPVKTMITAMTEAKTGRWMKKLTITERVAQRSPVLVQPVG